MPSPPGVLPHIYAASGSYLRDAFRRVHMGLGGDERLLQEANRSPAAYWEFQKLNVRQQPKDVQITLDNSAESLLAAVEARRDGRPVEYIEAKRIEASEAEYFEIPERKFLWPAKVRYARV